MMTERSLWISIAGTIGFFAASAFAHDPASHRSDNPEAGYLALNDAAMARMMADMAVAYTGDVDRDFVAMMVPHHQGAIDMAIAVLKHGQSERIRRIAQEIIISQQQEIVAMKLAVGEQPPAGEPAPTSGSVEELIPPERTKIK